MITSKQDAIRFAWDFLTKVLQLPQEKLLVTVYATDDEAYGIWANEIGVPAERIVRIGDNKIAPYASDNFWQMGDTGVAHVQKFHDHGADIWAARRVHQKKMATASSDLERRVYAVQPPGRWYVRAIAETISGYRHGDRTCFCDHARRAFQLRNRHLQGSDQNAAKIVGVTDLENKSLRVIADHIRSCSFLISDGVMPSNEGRGYVLRRIIRRAVRHGRRLGAKDTFFYQLVATLVELMGDACPDLRSQQPVVERVLKQKKSNLFARWIVVCHCWKKN